MGSTLRNQLKMLWKVQRHAAEGTLLWETLDVKRDSVKTGPPICICADSALEIRDEDIESYEHDPTHLSDVSSDEDGDDDYGYESDLSDYSQAALVTFLKAIDEEKAL